MLLFFFRSSTSCWMTPSRGLQKLQMSLKLSRIFCVRIFRLLPTNPNSFLFQRSDFWAAGEKSELFSMSTFGFLGNWQKIRISFVSTFGFLGNWRKIRTFNQMNNRMQNYFPPEEREPLACQLQRGSLPDCAINVMTNFERMTVILLRLSNRPFIFHVSLHNYVYLWNGM